MFPQRVVVVLVMVVVAVAVVVVVMVVVVGCGLCKLAGGPEMYCSSSRGAGTLCAQNQTEVCPWQRRLLQQLRWLPRSDGHGGSTSVAVATQGHNK